MGLEQENSSRPLWQWLVGLIVIIIGVILAAYWAGDFNDFSISVNPMDGETKAGGVLYTAVTIDREVLYKHDITIKITENPSNCPYSITDPKADVSPLSISTRTDLPPGDYEVKILGEGQEGTKHYCTYTFTIKPSRPAPVPITTTTPPPTIPSPQGEISEPKEGNNFSIRGGTVKGYQRNIPENQYLCVFAKNPGDNQYYPQRNLDLISDRWVQELGSVGYESDIGSDLGIFLVLLDQSANDEINRSFSKWLNTYPGMPALPKGSIVVDSVWVELTA